MKKVQYMDKTDSKKSRPAATPEARENQLIALATDLAEQQLKNGTASSQVIAHYLKLGTIKARTELEILEKEKELLVAKTEAIRSQKQLGEIYAQALEAMKSYSGSADIEEVVIDEDL